MEARTGQLVSCKGRVQPTQQSSTYQHIYIENPTVLPGTNAEGCPVDAVLAVKYPVEGVSNLCAKLVTSSAFKLRSGIGRTKWNKEQKSGVSLY